MLTNNSMIIVSLIFALVSVKVLVDTIRERRQLFDPDLTPHDRQRIAAAAFFLLFPISVIFHELGHAVLIKAFGASITGYGYYLFYGYVAYIGYLTYAQVFWIALAGNLVSILLGVGALAWVYWRPARPAINYLLLMFAFIDLANSLIFYPALDLLAGFEGDWSQIYSSRTPTLSIVTGIIHGSLILLCIAGWRSTWARTVYADRTDQGRPQRQLSVTEAGAELLQAGELLAGHWRHPLHVVADAQNGAAGVTMQWISQGYGRVVAAYAVADDQPRIELHGGLHTLDGAGTGYQQPLGMVNGHPRPSELSPILVHALDIVEGWEPAKLSAS